MSSTRTSLSWAMKTFQFFGLDHLPAPQNLKVPSALVPSNVEEILAMIHVVAVLLFAPKKKDEGGLRLVGPQIPELCSIRAKVPKQYVFLASGFVHAQPEILVLLLHTEVRSPSGLACDATRDSSAL